MSRRCSFQRPGFNGEASWQLEDQDLLIAPEGLTPEAYSIRDLRGVSGDDYTVRLALGSSPADAAATASLGRLGNEGSSLLAALRRSWLPQRAAALRLTGSGVARPYRASVAWTLPDQSGESQPCHLLLYEDLCLLARDGQDLEPLFLAQLARVVFDQESYSVICRGWDGASLTFSRLAGETEEFLASIQGLRAALAVQASDTLACRLPTLPASARVALASAWLPTRILSLPQLEALSTGAIAGIEDAWLSSLPRRAEARALRAWAGDGAIYLAHVPTGDWAVSRDEESAGGESEQAAGPRVEESVGAPGSAPEPEPGSGESMPRAEPAAEGGPHLWLLACRGPVWLLENLSAGGFATYQFEGGPEVPVLVEKLLAAPQFSREALYLPLEELTGVRADLASAARDLSFLVDLRRRFRGRLLHRGLESWKKGLP